MIETHRELPLIFFDSFGSEVVSGNAEHIIFFTIDSILFNCSLLSVNFLNQRLFQNIQKSCEDMYNLIDHERVFY